MRPYKSQSNKLHPKTIIGFFVCYCVGSRGSRFYYPDRTARVIEYDRAVYLEDDFFSSQEPREIIFREECVIIHIPVFDTPVVCPTIDGGQVVTHDVPMNHAVQEVLDTDGADILLRRLQKVHRPTIPNYYIVYLQEHEYDISDASYLVTYQEAIISSQSSFWINAMKDEMSSMSQNDVWDLVELPQGYKPIRCRWVFKTKCDYEGQVERFKARLVAKGFSQRECDDYKETVSPNSTKDSFKIIMVIVVHFDLELHQMD